MRVHCKNCIYYVPFVNNPDSVSEHVCGYFLDEEVDPIGNTVFKKYGEIDQCDHCKTVVRDDRRVVTRSCLDINAKYNCKFFKAKKSIITTIKSFIGRKNANTKH